MSKTFLIVFAVFFFGTMAWLGRNIYDNKEAFNSGYVAGWRARESEVQADDAQMRALGPLITCHYAALVCRQPKARKGVNP